MSKQKDTLKSDIKSCITTYFLKSLDPDAKVDVTMCDGKWIKITIVSHIFQYLTENDRKDILNFGLQKIGYKAEDFPILTTNLLTPFEAENFDFEIVQIPLWSNVLMLEEEAIEQATFRDIETCTVFSFHSVGDSSDSTNTLSVVANILANEHELDVVVLDLNFTNPYFSTYVIEDNTSYGAIDYIYERRLSPNNDIPHIETCLYDVNSDKGNIILIPVSNVIDKTYLHRLAEFDKGAIKYFYKDEENPIRQLIKDIKDEVQPDIILINAETGFTDLGSVALLDLADFGIITFNDNALSFQMMGLLMETVSKNQLLYSRPYILFDIKHVENVNVETMKWCKDIIDDTDVFHTKIRESSRLDIQVSNDISNEYYHLVSKICELID